MQLSTGRVAAARAGYPWRRRLSQSRRSAYPAPTRCLSHSRSGATLRPVQPSTKIALECLGVGIFPELDMHEHRARSLGRSVEQRGGAIVTVKPAAHL